MQYNPTAPGQNRESLISSINSLFACKNVIYIPGYCFFQDKKNISCSDHSLCYDCRI